MKTERVTQCKLERNGNLQTAWIESRGAKLGANVELKEDGQLWTVREVYSSMDQEEHKGMVSAQRDHRKGSDV
jgi:hypothetical protein